MYDHVRIRVEVFDGRALRVACPPCVREVDRDDGAQSNKRLLSTTGYVHACHISALSHAIQPSRSQPHLDDTAQRPPQATFLLHKNNGNRTCHEHRCGRPCTESKHEPLSYTRESWDTAQRRRRHRSPSHPRPRSQVLRPNPSRGSRLHPPLLEVRLALALQPGRGSSTVQPCPSDRWHARAVHRRPGSTSDLPWAEAGR